VLQQQGQYLERLFLKANSQAVLAQFAGAQIQLENPKTEPHPEMKIFLHEEANPGARQCTTREQSTGAKDGDIFL
jgi:hypothetical protein